MTANITWVIQWMKAQPMEGSLTDVVVEAGWICNGAQTSGETIYTASSYGSAFFAAPEGSFTPYDQLTESQVLGWCWASGVDKGLTEADVQAQIDAKITPPVVQLPLPWVTPSA